MNGVLVVMRDEADRREMPVRLIAIQSPKSAGPGDPTCQV